MRLRRLDLTRYGKFTDRVIDFGERVSGQPDLHIVYGPNEAGKSTAFAGFLDLLFGIERESRYGFLHPYATMRIGACLELSAGARELVRIKRAQASLRDDAEQPVADGVILGDLGGLDRGAYRTMFSLDDDTLEAGGKSILASNGELGQLLFSASAGLSDLSKTLVDLREESDRFHKPNTRKDELSELKANLAGLKAERDAIDTLASEYNRLTGARDSAALQYEAALTARRELQARVLKVQRMLAALPRLAALRQLQERRQRFEDVPDAPPGWLADLPVLQQAEDGHRIKIELADAEVARLREELAAIVVDEDAIRFTGSLGRLGDLRVRYRAAELDLPERRRELGHADGEISQILKRLGQDGEPDPMRLLLDAAQTAALSRLIEARSGIDGAVSAADAELSEAAHHLTDARRALQEAAGSDGSASGALDRLMPVRDALAALRDSDHASRHRSATRARAQRLERVAEQLVALAPWHGSADHLAGLRVPEAAVVKARETAAARHAASVDQRTREAERHEDALARDTAERDAIGSIAGLVDDQTASVIRAAREAAWAAHRRVLDGATADAFEAALRRDDMVGSARLGHERDLAKLHEIAQKVAVTQAECARARTLLDAAIADRLCHDDAMAAAVAAISPLLPGDMSATELLIWMMRRDKVLEDWAHARQCERDLSGAAEDAAALAKKLTGALRLAAVPFDGDADLDALAATAQSAIEREARLHTLRLEVSERERAMRKRELALQKAALDDERWHAAWRAACSACWLAHVRADLAVEVVREVLAALTELGPALRVRAGLVDRIRDMEADTAVFEEELARLTEALQIGRTNVSGLEVAQAVEQKVEDACRARDAKRQTEANLAAAHDHRRAVAAEAAMHADRIRRMTEFYQVGSLLEVAGKLRDAGEKAELERQAANAERDILASLHIPTLAEAETLLQSASEHELESEQSDLERRCDDSDKRTRELFAASKEAADRIEAIGGDDAAARIEERRRTKLLEIEDKALHYLRLRVGIAAAERALRAYRDTHRSSMMAQASDAFRIISRGAYRGLSTQPDKQGDILVAVGADGGSKLATDLSKGTRFQLYLALRAAGYQEFAKLRHPVPFIADDIMETFDDFRAEEALRLFGEMAKVGQVIYLTHHDHLCAIAQRTIPDVQIHRLAPAG